MFRVVVESDFMSAISISKFGKGCTANLINAVDKIFTFYEKSRQIKFCECLNEKGIAFKVI